MRSTKIQGLMRRQALLQQITERRTSDQTIRHDARPLRLLMPPYPGTQRSLTRHPSGQPCLCGSHLHHVKVMRCRITTVLRRTKSIENCFRMDGCAISQRNLFRQDTNTLESMIVYMTISHNDSTLSKPLSKCTNIAQEMEPH